MMKTRWQKPRSVTESGQFPKPDVTRFASQEAPAPPAPTTDPASITGVLPIVAEGEDRAKQRDDSAAGKKG